MVEIKLKPTSGDIFADLTNIARTRAWKPTQAAPNLRPTPKPAAKQVVYGMMLDIMESFLNSQLTVLKVRMCL
jgi:hypothetical protein